MGGNRMRWAQCARLWAGLAVLGVMVGGGREARAALTGLTITGTGGTVTGTDPSVFYTFDVELAAGFTMAPGDSFQINGLLGASPLNFPRTNPSLPSPGSVSFQPSPFNNAIISVTSSQVVDSERVYTSSVQWVNPTTLAGGQPGVTFSGGTNGLDLTNGGANPFAIFTVDIPAAAIPPSLTLTYSAVLDGGRFIQPVGSAGPIVIDFFAVPEPSTLVFLVSAVAVVPAAILWKRRRRRGAPVAE